MASFINKDFAQDYFADVAADARDAQAAQEAAYYADMIRADMVQLDEDMEAQLLSYLEEIDLNPIT